MMTTKILSSSLIYRAGAAFIAWYRYSLIAAFVGFMSEIFGRSDEMLRRSNWTALLTRFNSACARFGRAAVGMTSNSLIVRFWHSKAMRASLLYKYIFAAGMQRVILVVFALYLPIDYVLRNYIPIAVVGSLWDEAFLLFGFLYAVFIRITAEKALEAKSTPLDMPMLLFVGVSVFLFLAVDNYFSIAAAGFRAVVQYMLWFFVLTRIIKNDGDAEAFCITLIAVGTGVALHGIYQYIVGVAIPETWVARAEVGVRTRVFSIIGSPNVMGSFMVMLAPLAAAYAYKVKNLWLKVFMWGCTFVMCIACLFTFSRAAWFGMAVAIVIFAVARDKRLLVLMLLAAAVALFIPEITNRVAFLFTKDFAYANANGGREGRFIYGIQLFERSFKPFGLGFGRYGGAVAMQNQIDKSIFYYYVDNYYFKTMLEMGYAGVAAYALLVISTLECSIRAIWRRKQESMSVIAIGLLSGMVGVLVHSFNENIFEVPYMNAYFWAMAAIIIYIGFMRKPSATPVPKK